MLHYFKVPTQSKSDWLQQVSFEDIAFQKYQNQSFNAEDKQDWNGFIALIDVEVRAGKDEKAIFKFFTNGLTSNYESAIYAKDTSLLLDQLKDFLQREKINLTKKSIFLNIDGSKLRQYAQKPFSVSNCYWDVQLYEKPYLQTQIFGSLLNQANQVICITFQANFQLFASEKPFHKDFLEKTVGLPRFRFDEKDNFQENITDWALHFFKDHYETAWQTQMLANQFNLKRLFDFDGFENCQVEADLALEMRHLILLTEQPKEINLLFKTIQQPNTKTEEIFKKVVKIFEQVKRSFDKIGKKATKNKESLDVLAHYFEEANEAVQALHLYFNEVGFQHLMGEVADLEKEINKENIFYYAYAVLNDKNYQIKYAEFLKNQFPRLPLHTNFWQWVNWGKELWQFHTTLESKNLDNSLKISRKPLEESDEIGFKKNEQFKIIFLRDKQSIELYSKTEKWIFVNIPKDAWSYQLGDKPFLQMVLEYFQTLKSLENIEQIVKDLEILLRKLIPVCVETQRILQMM